jgi:hypothetical protein
LPETTSDPALHLVANGRNIRPIYGESGLYIFPVPRGAGEVRILSRAASATETQPWVEDRRRLGVRVSRLVLRGANTMRDIALDHPMLGEGWWAVERDNGAMRRWTKGDAVLPLPTLSEPAVLEMHLSQGMRYVLAPEEIENPGAESRAA